jgi:hypothetical protein
MERKITRDLNTATVCRHVSPGASVAASAGSEGRSTTCKSDLRSQAPDAHFQKAGCSSRQIGTKGARAVRVLPLRVSGKRQPSIDGTTNQYSGRSAGIPNVRNVEI